MSFKKIKLKHCYDSESEDVLSSFYIPLLSHSKNYYRLAGFFSSTTLAVAARGIVSLILSGGKMKLITGAKLTKSDVKAICKGLQRREEVLKSILVKDLQEMETEFIRDHVRALAWMVANGSLEIKIAILKDERGKLLSVEEVEKSGIFHPKIGIFEDEEGNKVSFSGSINESATAWIENIEEFKVFRSWIEGEAKYVDSDLEKFNKYWYNFARRAEVMDLPEAVRKKLIEIAPEELTELKQIWRGLEKKLILRDYQEEAIKKWIKAGKKGIFEMATGVGKTFVALGCIREIQKHYENFVVVIVCSLIHHISNPWLKRLKEFNFKNLLPAFEKNFWKKLRREILNINSGLINSFITLVTYTTFASPKFKELVKKIEVPILVIADEVHYAGAPKWREGLLRNYKFRIGLSATPRRWWDDEGTKIIYEYFGGTIYEFPIKKAIEKGCLVPYEYRPLFVELTDDEFLDYIQKTRDLAKRYNAVKDEEEKTRLCEILAFQRANITKNAKKKIEAFKKILHDLSNIKHCLVFCSSHKQVQEIQKILEKEGIIHHRFTEKESKEERKKLLKEFENGRCSILIGEKCLDETVDIPSARIAIILASSTNPREFIQRRGRVLRKYPGKSKAIIYDVIVLPFLKKKIIPFFEKIEKRILTTELRRYKELAETSLNRWEAFKKIIPLIEKYNLVL